MATSRTLKLTFLTDDEEEFNLSLNYASEDLSDDVAPITALVSEITTNQPFEVTIASCSEAALVTTTTTTLDLTA